MKLLVPIVIVGVVGGLLDGFTDLHKIWCFLIGVVAFFLFVFIKSIFIAFRIMRENKGAKTIWIDQNNKVVKTDNEYERKNRAKQTADASQRSTEY